MTIKRGVSLYSYQQEQFFKRMNWKDMIREIHDNLKTDGVEIICDATVPHYPFPPEEFYFDWNNEMARYNMKAVTMDVYLDVLQFRDHIMNYDEAAERLKYDIRIAAKMGFENVRCLSAVPLEVMIKALPAAEKYNVRIGREIHAPAPIKKDPNREMGTIVQDIVDYVDRTNCKFIGLVPDFGIFQHSPSRVSLEYQLRCGTDPKLIDLIKNAKAKGWDQEQLRRAAIEMGAGPEDEMMLRMSFIESPAKPEDIEAIVPYIFSIHGKFYEMTEIEGQPGHYEDKSIDYANPIKYLKKHGFDGYINSEYEGQRSQQDRGEEFLPNEVEEVRRHHEMLARLIAE